MPRSLFQTVVVPVANEEDARATGRALSRYIGPESEVAAVHVIEKAGGAPDKASVEQRRSEAGPIFTALAATLDVPLEPELRYGTDVAETIIDAAADLDASAIVFTPRGGSRWIRILTGDVGDKLVESADRPVVVLPDTSASDDDADGPGAESNRHHEEEGESVSQTAVSSADTPK